LFLIHSIVLIHLIHTFVIPSIVLRVVLQRIFCFSTNHTSSVL